jgi:hypothetical protein
MVVANALEKVLHCAAIEGEGKRHCLIKQDTKQLHIARLVVRTLLPHFGRNAERSPDLRWGELVGAEDRRDAEIADSEEIRRRHQDVCALEIATDDARSDPPESSGPQHSDPESGAAVSDADPVATADAHLKVQTQNQRRHSIKKPGRPPCRRLSGEVLCPGELPPA